jgi:hypothetical protein
MNKTLLEKVPIQTLKKPTRKTAISNLNINNDAIILTILKNYDWLEHLGIKCRCGNIDIIKL